MEFDVLLGSINTIRKDKPIVVVEMLGGFEMPNNINIFNLFESIGYKYTIVNENCAFSNIFDNTKCRNVIFTPNL